MVLVAVVSMTRWMYSVISLVALEAVEAAFSKIFSEAAEEDARLLLLVDGADLRYDMEIDFEDAVYGADKKITIPRMGGCDKCNSTGM